MINVAIVGLGFMGVTHIKAYRKIKNARLAAVCDAARLPVDGDLSYVAGNVGDKDAVRLDMSSLKATKNLDELLNDPEIDLIDLCVPTLAHPKLAIMALNAGKHVVCEKPLARTSALAKDIVDAARNAKGYFMPAMCMRFWPEYRWVKEAIESRRYGKALSARFRRVGEVPAWGQEHFLDGTKSGGAILDLHIHDADFVQFCFGRPRAVFASGLPLYSGCIDHVMAQYFVEGGATVSAEGSWAMTEGHGFSMSYTVVFEHATADFDCNRADALRLFEKKQKPQVLKLGGEDGYVGELQHMIDCIESKTPPSIVTGQDGMGAVELCEAEERSIATGKVVEM